MVLSSLLASWLSIRLDSFDGSSASIWSTRQDAVFARGPGKMQVSKEESKGLIHSQIKIITVQL